MDKQYVAKIGKTWVEKEYIGIGSFTCKKEKAKWLKENANATIYKLNLEEVEEL